MAIHKVVWHNDISKIKLENYTDLSDKDVAPATDAPPASEIL